MYTCQVLVKYPYTQTKLRSLQVVGVIRFEGTGSGGRISPVELSQANPTLESDSELRKIKAIVQPPP